jgi:hypothetical protein
MVIVLGVVLALALAYAVHTMMSLNKGGSGAKPEPATATTVASSPTPTPTATPSALPAAPTLSGAAPVSATPTTTPTGGDVSSQLVTAVKAPAGAGQLQSFSLFESKDPFNAAGPGTTHSSSGGTKHSGGSKPTGGGGSSGPPKAPPAPPTPPPTSAVISVNGSSESVSAGANFPAANPMFELVSLTNSTAKIAVAGGSYANGAATVTLKVNTPVTLVNTADGTRYTIELMPQGTAVSSTPASSGPSATPATTTTPSG